MIDLVELVYFLGMLLNTLYFGELVYLTCTTTFDIYMDDTIGLLFYFASTDFIFLLLLHVNILYHGLKSCKLDLTMD